MNRFEQIEERSEVIFTSKQMVFLALGIVILVISSFILGFSMGKKTERKKAKLGLKQNNDLLARLDKLEEESKSFKAKQALTVLRKREIPVDTIKEDQPVKVLTPKVSFKKRKSAKKATKYSLALARRKHSGFGRKYKIAKRRKTAKKRRIVKRKAFRRTKVAKRINAKSRRRRRRVYSFKKSSRRTLRKASLR